MKQEMLINVAQPEECRIAIVEDGLLEELYVERSSQDNYVGNIYKGKIVNLEPSIQAAFVDFGVGRNGFLHISDVESQYFRQGGYDPNEIIQPDGSPGGPKGSGRSSEGGRRGSNGSTKTATRRARPGVRPRFKPPIQEIFRRGATARCCLDQYLWHAFAIGRQAHYVRIREHDRHIGAPPPPFYLSLLMPDSKFTIRN